MLSSALQLRDLPAIDVQEHQRGDQCRALVAVQESVVLHDMEEVGRGHFEQIGMQQLSERGGARLLDGRLEQSRITHPDDTAELIQLECVNLEHFLEVQELGCDHLASLASVFAWALTILAADANAVLLVASDRTQREHVAIRRDLEGRILIDLEQLQDRAVQNHSQAVSDTAESGISLDKSGNPTFVGLSGGGAGN